jgi:putative ABC transport system permease protein
MNIFIILRVSFKSLLQHPMRSLLTMLGIIIGVLSIVTVRSIGEGAKIKVAQQIQNLGSNFVIAIAGSTKNRNVSGGRGSQGALTLKKKEFDIIEGEIPYIAYASPGIGTSVTARYEEQNWKTTLIGTNEVYPSIRVWPCISGAYFNQNDVNSASKTIVLGLTVAQKLFGNNDPTGKKIRINKIPFLILGVLTPKGKRPDGRDEDDMIFAPWTTVQRKIMGLTDGFSVFIFSATNKESTPKLVNEIRSILRQQHKLTPQDEDDFTVFSQDEIAKASDQAQTALTLLLLLIASIALLVGGIGIMNIMLVTVSERTKEIGIRLALGAQTSDILLQFVIESIIICIIGGSIGIGLGIGCALLIGSLLQWTIRIAISSIILGLGSSICIGLFFGYYPAYIASSMNPVDALAER